MSLPWDWHPHLEEKACIMEFRVAAEETGISVGIQFDTDVAK